MEVSHFLQEEADVTAPADKDKGQTVLTAALNAHGTDAPAPAPAVPVISDPKASVTESPDAQVDAALTDMLQSVTGTTQKEEDKAQQVSEVPAAFTEPGLLSPKTQQPESSPVSSAGDAYSADAVVPLPAELPAVEHGSESWQDQGASLSPPDTSEMLPDVAKSARPVLAQVSEAVIQQNSSSSRLAVEAVAVSSEQAPQRLTADVDDLLHDLVASVPEAAENERQTQLPVASNDTVGSSAKELHSVSTSRNTSAGDAELQRMSIGHSQVSEPQPEQAAAAVPVTAGDDRRKSVRSSNDGAELRKPALSQAAVPSAASSTQSLSHVPDDQMPQHHAVMPARGAIAVAAAAVGAATLGVVAAKRHEASLDVPLDRDYDQCLEQVMSELTSEALPQDELHMAALPNPAPAAAAAADADGDDQDQVEAEEPAVMAAAKAASVELPARPVSPVALQLAMSQPEEQSADQSASQLAAAASPLQIVAAEEEDEAYSDDVFDTAPEETISNTADDALASLPQQIEQDSDADSLSGASAESVPADDDADQQQRRQQSRFSDEAYDNDAFDDDDDEEEQVVAQPEASEAEMSSAAAQPEAVEQEEAMAMSIQPRSAPMQTSVAQDWRQATDSADSSAQASPSQTSPTQDSPTQASDAANAEPAVPLPPSVNSITGVRRPARPVRAFMRRTSSLTKPTADSDTSSPYLVSHTPAATPTRPPQAPSGPPPRQRGRARAPLGHQVSVSGLFTLLTLTISLQPCLAIVPGHHSRLC